MLGFEQSHTKNSSFQDNQNFITQAIIPIEYTNAIAYGQTGSGKSTGFILPNIINRLQNSHNLIIYDYKNNLSNSVKTMLLDLNMIDSLYELGVEWGEGINLLKYLELNEILEWLRSFDKGKDPYWINSATSLFAHLYETLLYLNEIYKSNGFDSYDMIGINLENLTFKDIFLCVDEFVIEKITKASIILINHIQENKENNSLISFYHKKLYENYVFLHKFSSDCVGDLSSASGNKGVLGVLKNAISSISNADFLNDKNGSLNKILKKRAVLIVYPNCLDSFSANLLNQTFFKILKTKNKKPFTIFVDEAHKILGKGFIPEVSVCREFLFEYILSTQNNAQLKEVVGDLAYEQFNSNIAHQISFYNPTDYVCDDLDTFEFRVLDISKNKSNSKSKINKPYFYDKNKLEKADKQYFAKCFNKFDFYDIKTMQNVNTKELEGGYLKNINSVIKNVLFVKNSKTMELKILPKSKDLPYQDEINSLIQAMYENVEEENRYKNEFDYDQNDDFNDNQDDESKNSD